MSTKCFRVTVNGSFFRSAKELAANRCRPSSADTNISHTFTDAVKHLGRSKYRNESPLTGGGYGKPVHFVHRHPKSYCRSFSTTTKNVADITSSIIDSQLAQSLPQSNQDIRQRLRTFEDENNAIAPIFELRKYESRGSVDNSLSRHIVDNNDFSTSTEDDSLTHTDALAVQDLVESGNLRTFLLPGDLVELRTANHLRIELAIFVRDLETQSQFYTMSGRWIHQRNQNIKFFVPEFVKQEELCQLLEFLPQKDVPEALQNRLQNFNHALPRDIGAPLVREMMNFWDSSESGYRSAATVLDKAHAIVANDSQLRLASLLEIANELIPSARDVDGKFSSPVLYAIHRCIMQDTLGFRAQISGQHRIWGQYEISSLEEVHIVIAVTNAVRKYQENCININRGTDGPKCDGFLGFIEKAKKLISFSRITRQFTPHGILGPVNCKQKITKPQTTSDTRFSGGDKYILKFIQYWCAYRKFNPSSHLNGLGSTILRATGMYEGVELDQTTAWTFLQEVGAIEQWANPAAFDLRLPEAGSKIQVEKAPRFPNPLTPDPLSSIRKDWGSLPVFCIDAPSALEIDDGVSLEETEVPGQFWIHVHTADPASQIRADSDIAEWAQRMGQNVYFPEHVTEMLPSRVVKERFSLAADRPCLTFSAKVSEDGELLDYEVTCGVIHNVTYITPETLNEVSNAPENRAYVNITLGEGGAKSGLDRCMKNVHELTAKEKGTLKVLYDLSSAHHRWTSLRGAVSVPNLESSIAVNVPPRVTTGSQSGEQQDLSITMSLETRDATKHNASFSPVAHMMLMAGNVAARWCHDRNVPSIYRVSQHNLKRSDPVGYFRTKILPSVKSGKEVPSEIISGYLNLLGPVLPSTAAGPHLALGLDMYSKVTSPLRRFCDLVVHWQIEATLLEEARKGRALSGNLDHNYLPFTKQDIESIIPQLDTRERIVKLTQRSAQRTWIIHALIRAWKFEAVTLPPLEFITQRINGHSIRGQLRLGGVAARLLLPTWMKKSDIGIGDAFEVELVDLNAYTRQAEVRLRRKI